MNELIDIVSEDANTNIDTNEDSEPEVEDEKKLKMIEASNKTNDEIVNVVKEQVTSIFNKYLDNIKDTNSKSFKKAKKSAKKIENEIASFFKELLKANSEIDHKLY